MPSIEIEPESPPESATGGPVIAGSTHRRPSSRTQNLEPVRSEVELASGETRAYDKGRRRVVSLSWSKLTGVEVDALIVSTSSPFVSYSDDADSPVYVMGTGDGLSFDAVAGTYPIRYSASLTLRERKPTR